MKQSPKTGGPAFPRPASKDEGGDYPVIECAHDGMTLRDWFAGKALAGFIANSDMPDMLRKGFRPDGAAEACYTIADAMIAARTPAPLVAETED